LEFVGGNLKLVQTMGPQTVAGLEGPIDDERVERLRTTLAMGYVLTRHDPDDGFFRSAEIVSLDHVLSKMDA
jgi:hypothetical protein